jgi:hypothetical protein
MLRGPVAEEVVVAEVAVQQHQRQRPRQQQRRRLEVVVEAAEVAELQRLRQPQVAHQQQEDNKPLRNFPTTSQAGRFLSKWASKSSR